MLFLSVVIADEWANQIPSHNIFLFNLLFGSLFLILKIPSSIIVDHFLEFLPFQVISLPDNHILINELMTSVSYRSIVQLMSVSSESLDLMTLLAPVNSISKHITIVALVALAPAKWTHLITSKSLGLHYLIEVSNKLIFLKCNRISPLHFNFEGNRHLTHQALNEVINIRDELILNTLLQYTGIRLEELNANVLVCH